MIRRNAKISFLFFSIIYQKNYIQQIQIDDKKSEEYIFLISVVLLLLLILELVLVVIVAFVIEEKQQYSLIQGSHTENYFFLKNDNTSFRYSIEVHILSCFQIYCLRNKYNRKYFLSVCGRVNNHQIINSQLHGPQHSVQICFFYFKYTL